MKRYNLTKHQDSTKLLKTTPLKEHYDIVISEDTSFYLNGICIGIYVNVAKELLTYVREAV